MKRRTLAALLCAALLLTLLCGCGGAEVPEAVPADREAADAAPAATDTPVPAADGAETLITFTDTGAEITGFGAEINQTEPGRVEIHSPGTYRLTGAAADARLVVECSANDHVDLILDGVELACEDDDVLYVKTAGSAVLTIADGTENILASGALEEFVAGETNAEEDAAGAALRYKCPLTINGGGTLTVAGYINNGIGGSGDLTLSGGVINVASVNDAVHGKGSVTIEDGVVTLVSSGDGISADETLTIAGGTVSVTTGVGADDAEMKVSDSSMFGNMGGMGGDRDRGSDESGEDASDEPAETDEAASDEPAEADETASDEPVETDGAASDEPAEADTAEESSASEEPAETDGAASDEPAEADTAEESSASDEPAETDETASDEPAESGGASGEGDTSDRRSGMPAGGFDQGWDMDDESGVSCKGLKAGTTVISGGSVLIDAEDDGIHGNGDVTITGGAVQVRSGDDGVHADGTLTIAGGTLDVQLSYEGLEGTVIIIEDGVVNVEANDDGMNVNGGGSFFGGPSGEAAEETEEDEEDDGPEGLIITGGTVTVASGGDGLDSNGSLHISGGLIFVSGASSDWDSPLDYGDGNAEFVISGGTVMAAGYSGMAEAPDIVDEAQGAILYAFSDNAPAGTLCQLKDEDGNVLMEYSFVHEYNCVVLSGPGLETGRTYTLSVGDRDFEIEMTSVVTSNRSRGGMGMGGGMGDRSSDLEHVDLSSLDLENIDLEAAGLGGLDLSDPTDVDLSGLDFSQVDYSIVDLRSVRLGGRGGSSGEAQEETPGEINEDASGEAEAVPAEAEAEAVLAEASGE